MCFQVAPARMVRPYEPWCLMFDSVYNRLVITHTVEGLRFGSRIYFLEITDQNN
jgi:hypothetical protein